MGKDTTSEHEQVRTYSGLAINLISSWPKVLEILDRKIPIPEVVEVFPTNFCNFDCPHCRFQSYHGTKNEYLELELFEKTLYELKESGIKTIEISGGGEPLAHPQIKEMLDIIIKYDFRVGLITNGYYLCENAKLAEKLIQCSNWIRFSLDAFTEETFQKVHGNKNISYNKLKTEINTIIKNKHNLPKIGLKMLISKLNWKDSVFAIDEAKSMNADYLQFKFLTYPKKLVLEEKKADELFKKLKDNIEKTNCESFYAEIVPPYKGPIPTKKCLMTFLHPVIDWDGSIYVCAFFEHRKKQHSIGNIHDGGFFKYWNSQNHMKVFDEIDPSTCMPNCPMLRYNPVIDYIKDNWHNFKFI